MQEPSPAEEAVRVLEYAGSGIVAGYAGWLLARIGARVTRLVTSGELQTSEADSPVQLALEALREGKQELPVPAEPAQFASLLAEVDILLCDAPKALEAAVGPIASLNVRYPRLVVAIGTPFGLTGPYAAHPGSALDAQALSGVAWSLGEAGREPLSLPAGITEHEGGAMLAAGALMALSAREERGTGRVVDVSLAEVLASYVAGNARLYIHHGLQWYRSGRRASGSGGAYPYVILPCKDGEVCICGRTREEWMRLVAVMGNPGWAQLPRYQDLRAMGKQYPEEVDALLRPWLTQHTMAELESLALQNNLIVSPIRSFAEVLRTAHFRAREFLVPGMLRGRTVQVPQLPFRASARRDEASPNFAHKLLATRAPAPRDRAVNPSRPLSGLRVLDFGWVWSAPWVGTILAELGAQVIKVEHGKRPDNLRLSGKIFRDGQLVEGPTKEMSPMYHQINHGKLGITLNAKEPRAVELLKRLTAMSDLVIENMSPGSMERTHLGYEVLKAMNPKLVMLAMSAAGQFGELASMRAYAPTMSSFVGMESLVGYPGEAPIGALNFALGDPNASVHALIAVLAALRRARATGQGCYIDLSQVEALLGILRPYLLETQITGRQSPPQGNRHGDMAPHGIYPAAGNDTWLTLAVETDAQWQALGRIAIGQAWAQEARYATRSGRLAEVAALDAAVASWTATRERDELVAQLRGAGIAASPVLSVQEQWRDEHFAARALRHPVQIPFYGREDMFRAPWIFSDFAPVIDRSGPMLGQHNDYVFKELLGLGAEEYVDLQQAGVIA